MSVGSVGYNLVLVLHVFAFVAWMAGIFYLPRLFVYHADAAPGSDKAGTFKVMERRLYRGIMMPAMVLTVVSGGVLAGFGGWGADGWLWAKAVLVAALLGLHFWLGRQIGVFAAGDNSLPSRTYRMINEVPTLILLGILVFAILKPF